MATATERRTVTYLSLRDFLEDAERCVAAHAPTSGNWSLGQIIEHMALILEKSLDGYDLTAPWFIRLVGPFLKRRVMRNKMKPGLKLPGYAAKVLVPGLTEPQTALEHLRRVIGRMETETQRAPSPIFGVLTIDEWNQIHLRHGEMHMSFARAI